MARFPDSEMIDFIAAGSERMYTRFCERWLERAIRMAAQRTADPILAQDIARRALIAVWDSAGWERGRPADAATWIGVLIDRAAGEVTVPPVAGTSAAVLADLAAVARLRPQRPPVMDGEGPWRRLWRFVTR